MKINIIGIEVTQWSRIPLRACQRFLSGDYQAHQACLFCNQLFCNQNATREF